MDALLKQIRELEDAKRRAEMEVGALKSSLHSLENTISQGESVQSKLYINYICFKWNVVVGFEGRQILPKSLALGHPRRSCQIPVDYALNSCYTLVTNPHALIFGLLCNFMRINSIAERQAKADEANRSKELLRVNATQQAVAESMRKELDNLKDDIAGKHKLVRRVAVSLLARSQGARLAMNH